MPLTVGTRIGPYEIIAPLGAGGMGEVYKARDTRLDRTVAIKILPDAFIADPARVARFQREAKTLASLNHGSIGGIYGLEESGGTTALVMELVDGEDLSQRIARGAIPIDEALAIARQIAEALEAAHDQGIIHRDLKPANIKVRPDGTVKVLDFGLAKAMETVGSAPNVSQSPTITTPAMMTGVGILLGTAAYMSPEQARGKTVDKRADIWAFGCVLFELLTGERPFKGEDVSDTLAAVLRAEPDWKLLPADLPPAIRTLVRHCVEKSLKQRIDDLSVVSFLLRDPTLFDSATTALMAKSEPPPLWRRAIPFVATAMAAGAVVAGLMWFLGIHFRESPFTMRTTRFQIPLPEKTTAPIFELSPDGRFLAITAAEGSRRRLWVRPLDALEAQPLPGTEDATYPFWSPDSAFIAFFAQGKLKKIALAGGPPQTLCDAPEGRGGTWSTAGVILFGNLGSAVTRVQATGGIPAPVTTLAHGGEVHRFPTFLPGGTRFLYVVSGTADTNGIYVGSRDGSPPVRLLPDESRAVYVPPDIVGTTGVVLFRRAGTVMAQPFNPRRLTLDGEMYPLAEQVGISVNVGNGAFSASETGVLAYSSGGRRADIEEFAWKDRRGRGLDIVVQPGRIGWAALSPDEKRILFSVFTGEGAEVWLHDVRRGLSSPFTTRPGLWHDGVWSPDGTRIVLVEGLTPPSSGIYQRPSNGTGTEELLFREQSGGNLRALDWSRDGKFVVYQVRSPATSNDLFLLPLDGDRQPVPYLQTPANESAGQFSPDSRWMAYASDESGMNQVYVQSIPANGDRRQISTAGGDQPRWRRDGRELFYVANDQMLMAVPVKTGITFETDVPQPLFQIDALNVGVFAYQPVADGQRFLVTTPVAGTTPPITVVWNWQAAIKK